MTVAVRAATDLGLRRTQNEDNHGSWVPSEPAERARRGVLIVVADGMGGSNAGEVASQLAVQTVIRSYREAPGDSPLDDLYRAVEAANEVVHRESVAHPEHSGMGTTCTAVVLRDRDAYFAHVGDSRAYFVHDGRIRQLTHDHSFVAQLVRDGLLTPDQARVDPRRNVLTRSVGVVSAVEIDAEHQPGLLVEGATLLLCTDGLHGLLDDAELQAAASSADLEQGCREAVALANQRGGPDNITLVLARVSSRPEVEEPPTGGEPAAWEANGRGVVAGPGPADEPPPPRRATRAGRKPNRTHMIMWLVVALAVWLIAVAAMALVLHRVGRQSKDLGSREPPQTGRANLAWR